MNTSPFANAHKPEIFAITHNQQRRDGMTDEKISAAWRADDDADAELMEIERLAKIARDSGAQAATDPVVSMWRKILGTVRAEKRKR